MNLIWVILRKLLYRHVVCLLAVLYCLSNSAFGQPANDNCSNASVITISNSGFGLGIFASSTFDLTSATVQTGETFAPAILQAGQSDKSVWYRFTIPTTRGVTVSLAQPGSAITNGDAGFTVYKMNGCLPSAINISANFTPIGVFGSTFHPCVGSGDYMVQVSGKTAANGPVYINIELAAPTAVYDQQVNAYQFGTLGSPNFTSYVNYPVKCQTIENSTEVCSSISNYQQYNKSTWHTFTTPAYFDYIAVMLSGTGSTTYFTNATTFEKFGYNLYAGDARALPFSSLTLVDGCDSLLTNGYLVDEKIYKCTDLQPNTTYSIQIFFHKDFINDIRVAVTFDGTAPTQAPEPILSLVPPSNKLGVLASNASGITSTVTDHLACNSRHSLHPCDPSLPANGIRYNGLNYNLSTFFTFTLSSTSKIKISTTDFTPPYHYYSTPLLIRLYDQDLTNTCSSLDTNNLVSPPFLSNAGFNLDCVPPGTYTLQVSGRDTLPPASAFFYYAYLDNPTYVYPFLSDLGKKFTLSINVTTEVTSSKYDLKIPGAFDTINRVSGIMQPLVNGVTYNSHIDTFGCANTVLPIDTSCAPGNTKAIYREFIVPDSGLVFLSGGNNNFYKLYKGDADALSIAQNVHSFPDHITGLTPYTECYRYFGECNGGQKVCVVPGTYTHVSFGGNVSYSPIGQLSQVSIKFALSNTIHDNPGNAENMGTLNPGLNTLTSSLDFFSCKNNAIPINGYQPCTISGNIATKAIYRQFYLSAPATIQVSGYSNYCGGIFTGPHTVFSGKATDGIAGLTPLASPFQCFTNASNLGTCTVLNPGWYTVVSYGSGPSYANPFQNISQQYGYSSSVGYPSQVTISATLACAGPKYNRPYKAAIDTTTGNPFLIQWGPRAGHTNAVPKTDTTYTLYREDFNCTVDTPFASHPIPNCNASLTKVAYYVFRTTQESYVHIKAVGFWGAVYKGDARTDSTLFGASTLIQPCLQRGDYIQLCKLQPGDYTLVIFGTSAQNCTNVIPTIYIDRVGYSRFDHANNAYDFGVIPPDSAYHYGKVGDVNPIDPARAPSSDFIYCTTGSRQTDPTNQAGCYDEYNSQIYNTGVNVPVYDGTTYATPNPFGIARRNLWYSFVIDKGGYVKVRVVNRTIGKVYQHPFTIYKSNADGTLPFSTVVSTGQVDSTIAQGLTYIIQNVPYNYCKDRLNEVTFYRDPCSSIAERYYIVIENSNSYPFEIPGMDPNSQMDVAILLDSVNAIQPQFDHYFQASNIGTNLGPGTYTGATDNHSCATSDPTDPIYGYNLSTCHKTLWYKFSTTVSGVVRFRPFVNGVTTTYYYQPYYIQLFRQIVPGDSTVNGLQIQFDFSTPSYNDGAGNVWGQACVSPGTYYIIIPGCSMLNEYVYPQIQLVEQAGDYCDRPVVATLNGAGTNVSSALVNCHTIGTDYGEFNSTLTCPQTAPTNQYKTSWFRIDITGADTLDVTTYLTENTNATSTDIKYRLMNGNCGAMQERSCVQDALTQDTYKCLAPGSYWIQVFTPITKNGTSVTGTIDLHLSAIHHADTCAPINNCLATSVFIPQFDCAVSEAASFYNLSTYGSNIQYNWDFGYNNQTSTSNSPSFVYPALSTSQTYTVKLVVQNNNCGGGDTSFQQITIPARPTANLGKDTILCSGTSLLLNATSWPGSTYLWQNGSASPTYNVTTTGVGTYHVRVTYNGCIKRDTIQVGINPITRRYQTHYLCGNDSVQLSSSRGYGETYSWNTGSTSSFIYANSAGMYINTLNWNNCIIKDTFMVLNTTLPFANPDTTKCYPFSGFTLNATVPGAQSYLWQNNSTAPTYNVTTPGIYWVRINFGTCFKRDTIIVKVSSPPVNDSSAVRICSGQSYTLPSGLSVNTAGVYRDTLRYVSSGCDSLRRVVRVIVQSPQSTTINPNICAGQNYTLPWGQVVSVAGAYKDTLHYALTGCDSIYRTVNLSIATPQSMSINSMICQGQSYTLPWGTVVSLAGVYKDTLHYAAGCDSLYRTVNLSVQTWTTLTTNPVICQGQSYTLPGGALVNTAGIYRDTLRYINTGCDSVRRVVNLTVQAGVTATTNSIICSGQSYTLPWGQVVTTAGTYRDTLRYTNTGCDSIRRIVNLSVQNWATLTINPIICSGQSYTLPSGQVVSNAGTYHDTLRYTNTGCDSIRRTVNLSVQVWTTSTINPIICSGQSYTLPWGTIVNTAGTYRDTLRYISTGCDSLYTIVDLTVLSSALVSNTNTVICSGQAYTLPWGAVVSAPGIYRDTIRFASGCDSLYRIINLTVQSPSSLTINPVICTGQSYTLPWGAIANASGVYNDTLRYTTGCDSLYRIINLTVKTVLSTINNASICAGQTYTLPWGAVANATGTYSDTLRYVITGCDSVRRTVILSVQSPQSSTIDPIICSGQTYTLPWGAIVNSAGTYRDTLRYINTGCDSVRRIVNLSVQTWTTATINPIICSGQTYTLPWGVVVTNAGTYHDTLRHINTGCDSIRRTVNLSVQTLATSIINPIICQGQSYTLPWGQVITAAGTYRDTLRYINTNCDSVRRVVTLTVQAWATSTINPIICSGQSYTLPWGAIVNTAGTYRDTLRYANTGCDSVRRSVNVTIQSSISSASSAIICAGQTYTLPWGTVVNTSGVYRDTLRYTNTGCDSIRRTVNLALQTSTTAASNVFICQGQSHTLPWGVVVNTSGVYRDTLRYRITNCDSVYRIVNVSVTPAAFSNINASICTGDRYTLPWGTTVTTAGIYRDTVRTSIGCDSLIRNVTLAVKPKPAVTISKSNDIDCMIGTSKLNATGGVNYLWQPSSSLSDPLVSNPVATPTATTVYKVQVTSANGCVKQDSIQVKVIPGVADNGFLLPNAFTPNNDGKNDCFGVRTWGNVTNLKFEIYNRWGELIFRTSDPSQCWDGIYKGEKQATAVFVYQVWADTFCGKVYRKGTVTLIR